MDLMDFIDFILSHKPPKFHYPKYLFCARIIHMKTLIMIFMVVGSTVGSYIPVLWGGSLLSPTSVLWGAIGGFAGIWAGWKIGRALGLE